MTFSAPVGRVVALLTAAGYRLREMPFTVSTVPFEFDAMLVGSERALDLIVVIDTLIEPEARIRQKVEGLSRALDLVASRRPLTVILVGPPPRSITVDAISRVSRVLRAGTPVGPEADRSLTDALAVLLPLTLPAADNTVVDPLSEVRRRLGPETRENETVEAVLEAASQGAEEVRDTLQADLRGAIAMTLGRTPA